MKRISKSINLDISLHAIVGTEIITVDRIGEIYLEDNSCLVISREGGYIIVQLSDIYNTRGEAELMIKSNQI